MKIAIIGSSGVKVNIGRVIPPNTSTIVCGSGSDLDSMVQKYAMTHNIPMDILSPQFSIFNHGVVLFRNKLIVQNADLVIAIWDGESVGTKHTIKYARAIGVPVKVYLVKKETPPSQS